MQVLSDAAKLELARRDGAKPRVKVLAYFDGATATDITQYVKPGGIGSISTGRGALLKEFETGDVTISLSNSGKEFCPEVAGSLLNGLRYHNKKVEVSAGLELPDGTTEYLPQFIGRIRRLTLNTKDATARILVRGILKQLSEAQICKPNVDASGNASPNPLDVPRVVDGGGNQTDGFSMSGLTTNPADAILAIATAAGIAEDDIDTASLDAARSVTSHLHLGMTFGADGNPVSALSAMREFSQACLATLYVTESGKLAMYVYAGQDIRESPPVFSWDSNVSGEGAQPVYDVESVVNKVIVRYGADLSLAYPPAGTTCEDADSLAAYGEMLKTVDCRAIQTEVDAKWLAEYILDAFKEPPLVVTCQTDFDALLVQLTDTVLLVDPNAGIQSIPMEVLRREFDPASCVCGFTLQKSSTRLLWFTLDDDGPAGELDGDAMLL